MKKAPTAALEPDLAAELSQLTDSLCKALNDPKRLLILYALGERPLTVGALTEVIDASQANTSQHLAVLRQRGLVKTERHNNTVIYSLRHPKIVEAIDLLREIMADEIARQRSLLPR